MHLPLFYFPFLYFPFPVQCVGANVDGELVDTVAPIFFNYCWSTSLLFLLLLVSLSFSSTKYDFEWNGHAVSVCLFIRLLQKILYNFETNSERKCGYVVIYPAIFKHKDKCQVGRHISIK